MPAGVVTRAAPEPWAGQLELAKQGSEQDALVILDATGSPTARARRTRSQECGNLPRDDPALNFQEERLGLGQCQAHLLQSLAILVQEDELLRGHLLVVLGNDHKLKLELERHAGDP
jgi:hypothetical protein